MLHVHDCTSLLIIICCVLSVLACDNARTYSILYPLYFSVDGLLDNEADVFLKQLANRLFDTRD